MTEVAWFLYLLEAGDGRATYVGVSTTPEARLAAHNGERAGGARRTRQGRPWRLLGWWGPFDGRGPAQAAEAVLKRLSSGERRARLRDRGAASSPWPGSEFLPEAGQIGGNPG